MAKISLKNASCLSAKDITNAPVLKNNFALNRC
jgi:hypothetical protein